MTQLNQPVVNFRKRIISASKWTFGGYALSQVIRLFSGVITSRLLEPEVFGLMSLVIVVMMGIGLLTDLGLMQSVIRSNHTHNEDYMNTIWTLQVIKGLLIWLLSILFSIGLYLLLTNHLLPVNTAYSNPLLPILIPVLTFSLVISGFEPTWTMLATKRMEQALLTKIELASQVGSMLVTIAWAYYHRTIWAIIVGWLAGVIVKSFLTYYFRPKPHNKWHLDEKFTVEILHFGKWILLSTLIGFYAVNGDRIMLGGLIDERQLGFYSIAYMFYNLMTVVYEKFTSGVVYSALSEAYHTSHEKLKSTYYKFRLYSDAAILFIAGGLFSAGHLIIDIIYDDRYTSAGPILQMLAIGLVALRYKLSDQCFTVINKPFMMTVSTLVRALFLMIALPLAYKYSGLNAAIWAIVFTNFSSIPFVLYFKYKTDLLDIKKEIILLPLFFIVGLKITLPPSLLLIKLTLEIST